MEEAILVPSCSSPQSQQTWLLQLRELPTGGVQDLKTGLGRVELSLIGVGSCSRAFSRERSREPSKGGRGGHVTRDSRGCDVHGVGHRVVFHWPRPWVGRSPRRALSKQACGQNPHSGVSSCNMKGLRGRPGPEWVPCSVAGVMELSGGAGLAVGVQRGAGVWLLPEADTAQARGHDANPAGRDSRRHRDTHGHR